MIAKEDNFKKLYDYGIKEIRFDLAATNFDSKILKKVAIANNIFDFVTVEVPSIPEVYDNLVQKKLIHQLSDYGISQLNMEELVIYTDICDEYYKNSEWYSYNKYFFEANSPTFSRMITYDVMEYVIENKLDILINDCSNDSQALQQMKRQANSALTMLSMMN